MVQDTTRPANAGSAYGPFVLIMDHAAQQRHLLLARRYQRAVALRAVHRAGAAVAHRVRLGLLSAGRFAFDHGGWRSVHR